ncbi:MAG: hypothetical protein ACE5HE_00065 [Phycisphaerae bacterium]
MSESPGKENYSNRAGRRQSAPPRSADRVGEVHHEVRTPISAERVLLHRGAMLMLDELTECGEGVARCRTTVSPDNPFLDAQGTLEGVALIEMLAQGAAALRGYEASRAGGRPTSGYLVGIKELNLTATARADDSLAIEVRQTFVLEQTAIMEARVLNGATLLAYGVLKVWEEPGLPAPPVASTTSPAIQKHPAQSAHSPGALDRWLRFADRASRMHRAVLDSGTRIHPCGARGQVAAEFSFRKAFPGFDGHFPSGPILPGVILLKTALVLAEGVVEEALELACVEKAKFTGRVLPRQPVLVEVGLAPDGATRSVRASVTSQGGNIATLRFDVRDGRGSNARDDAEWMKSA